MWLRPEQAPRPRPGVRPLALLCVLLTTIAGCSSTVASKPAVVPEVRLETIDRSEYEVLGYLHGTGEVGEAFCIDYGDSDFAYLWGERKGEPDLEITSAVPLFLLPLINIVVALVVAFQSIDNTPSPVAAATFDAWSQAPDDADLFIPDKQVFHGRIGCFASSRAEVWGRAVRLKNDVE